eukprot:1082250-Prymnesium_polylepis.1
MPTQCPSPLAHCAPGCPHPPSLTLLACHRTLLGPAQVEPVDAIMRRFCTGGMSLGALSREAHETLAMGSTARAPAPTPARAVRTSAAGPP